MISGHGKTIHTCGANGHMATQLVAALGETFPVECYSQNSFAINARHFLPLAELPARVSPGDRVVFFSYSARNADAIFLSNLLRKLAKFDVCIVYISSMAIYSEYRSTYAELKLEQERIVRSFKNWKIVRPGFVFGRNFGGLNEIFEKLARSRILFLPSQDARTYFIKLNVLTRKLKRIALEGDCENYEADLFEVNLNIHQALRLYGYTGFVLSLPSIRYRLLFFLFQKLKPVTPHLVQSLLSLNFMPHDFPNSDGGYRYLRRFILVDYASFFRKDDLWQLRRYIVNLEKNSSVGDYIQMTKSKRFMLCQRLNELVTVSKLQGLDTNPDKKKETSHPDG